MVKHFIALLCVSLLSLVRTVAAEPDSTKSDIVKHGVSLGPLPIIAYDQGKGLQYGVLLNVFDFGDGSCYPNVRQQWYIEASAYTGGSQQYVINYDSKNMIKWARISVATSLYIDKMLRFFGFNGYNSFYDKSLPKSFYSVERILPYFKADFIGKSNIPHLSWEAGYHFKWFRISAAEKEDDDMQASLMELYQKWGVIDETQGTLSSIRLGLTYDTRDFEPAPSKGIWAEGHFIFAPRWLGSSENIAGYSLSWRQYFPLINDRLVAAYRLAYQGQILDAPYYALPFYTVVGNGVDRDGFGGYRTTRGLLSNRVQGQDVSFGNAELRWKLHKTHLMNQNIYFSLICFADASMVTRKYRMSFNGKDDDRSEFNYHMALGESERPHISAGGGARIGINQNFIIALDYGVPFDKQDGNGAFYINTGFLF